MVTPRRDKSPSSSFIILIVLLVAVAAAMSLGRRDPPASTPIDAVPVPPAAQDTAQRIVDRMG